MMNQLTCNVTNRLVAEHDFSGRLRIMALSSDGRVYSISFILLYVYSTFDIQMNKMHVYKCVSDV